MTDVELLVKMLAQVRMKFVKFAPKFQENIVNIVNFAPKFQENEHVPEEVTPAKKLHLKGMLIDISWHCKKYCKPIQI